jgi:hypothetical protein
MYLEILYKESCKDFLWMTFKGMMTAMATDEPSSIQTRPSLLNRLKSGDDAKLAGIFSVLVRAT